MEEKAYLPTPLSPLPTGGKLNTKIQHHFSISKLFIYYTVIAEGQRLNLPRVKNLHRTKINLSVKNKLVRYGFNLPVVTVFSN